MPIFGGPGPRSLVLSYSSTVFKTTNTINVAIEEQINFKIESIKQQVVKMEIN